MSPAKPKPEELAIEEPYPLQEILADNPNVGISFNSANGLVKLTFQAFRPTAHPGKVRNVIVCRLTITAEVGNALMKALTQLSKELSPPKSGESIN